MEIKLTELEKKRLSKLNKIMLELCELINDGFQSKDNMKFIQAIEKSNEVLREYRKGRDNHLENASKLGIPVAQSTGYMDILN